MGSDTSKNFRFFLTAFVLPVLLSGIVRALGIYIFVSPNHFAPGGVNGAAVLLEEAVGWNSGWFLLMLNIPLFFLAFFLLGKKEAILSTLSMLLTSGLLIVFDWIKGFPKFSAPAVEVYVNVGGEMVAQEMMLENIAYGFLGAVAGGIFLGIALAVMLRCCGTAGGTAILASIVNKKWKFISVSWLTSFFDAIVVFASIFVYNKEASFALKLVPVLLALVSLFVTSKTCDVIINGFKTAYKFEIITKEPEAIAREIMEKTHHGATMMRATGMYTHEEHDVLVCIIRKRQIAEVQRIIKRYPGTFAFFSPMTEVYGKFLK